MSKRKAIEHTRTGKRPKTDDGCRYENKIGQSLYVSVNEFDGEIYIHIRKFVETSNKKYPTKTGAALTLIRWKEFISHISEIESSVEKLSTTEDVQFLQHLGGNWNVSVNKEFVSVDIRKYWLPEGRDDTVPTRKGISLKVQEFRKLVESFDDIKEKIPELANVVRCLDRGDHQNQLGALRCPECNPDDCQNW